MSDFNSGVRRHSRSVFSALADLQSFELTRSPSRTTSRPPTSLSFTLTTPRSATRPTPHFPSENSSREFAVHIRSAPPLLTSSAIFPSLLIRELKERPQKKGTTPARQNLEKAEEQRADAVTVPDDKEQAEEDAKWGKEAITQKYLWPTMSSFFRDNDVIVAETGTSAFGTPPFRIYLTTRRNSPDPCPSFSMQVSSISLTLPRPCLSLRSSGERLVGPSALLSERLSPHERGRRRVEPSFSVRLSISSPYFRTLDTVADPFFRVPLIQSVTVPFSSLCRRSVLCSGRV